MISLIIFLTITNHETTFNAVFTIFLLLPLFYVVWKKSNKTDFLLTMNFILFSNQGYPLQNCSLGQLHSEAKEALFPLFVAVLEGFCSSVT